MNSHRLFVLISLKSFRFANAPLCPSWNFPKIRRIFLKTMEMNVFSIQILLASKPNPKSVWKKMLSAAQADACSVPENKFSLLTEFVSAYVLGMREDIHFSNDLPENTPKLENKKLLINFWNNYISAAVAQCFRITFTFPWVKGKRGERKTSKN